MVIDRIKAMQFAKRAFRILMMTVVGIGSLSSQVLHNGIVLPDQWPPLYEETPEPSEMKVPYLVTRPEVIPINTGRQLFVDDFLIEETDLVSVIHQPTFYKNNPVMRSDRDWEVNNSGPFASPFSDGIWFDEKEDLFKMLYLAGKPGTNLHYTCYAESKNGINWVKPILELFGQNNVVDTFTRDASSFWLDKQEKDATKRFKMFNIEYDRSYRRFHAVLKYSADGIHWGPGVAHSGKIFDRTTFFYNPFISKWVLSLRADSELGRGRIRHYAEHEDPEMLVSLAHDKRDFVVDRNVKYWFSADNKEPRNPDFPEIIPQLYNCDAIAYESIMLGFFAIWQGPDNDVTAKQGIQKRNEVLIGYSRDGFHWSRPSHKPFMGVNMEEGAWNWANSQPIIGSPIIVGDSLYFFASGRRRNFDKLDTDIAPGLAKLRRDGFISKHSEGQGYLTTAKVNFNGDYLFVNADVKGELRVEILDINGKVIPGFRKDDCQPMKVNGTRHLITWKKRGDLKKVKGRDVRIKFYLRDGDLFSFWVSRWESGESNGYTGGGGRGLDSSGKDRP